MEKWQTVLDEVRAMTSVRHHAAVWDPDDTWQRIVRDMGDEIDRLKAELAAARSKPPRPAAIVRDGQNWTTWDAFEDQGEATKALTNGPIHTQMFRVDRWTWHPKKGGA